MKNLNILKTTVLIAILTFGILNTYSQKILFDNTKSEQAGNADWIPDADSRYPSPDQSGISGTPLPTTTGTVETYWSGALSYWAVEMAKRGYTIETLPSSGSITYGSGSNAQDLSNYDVFVVCEPNNPFTTSEKAAMLNFVSNGGGLFMIADHPIADRDGDGWDPTEVWNDFLASVPGNGFGMSFDTNDDYTNAPTTNIPNLAGDPLLHGVAGDVGGIEFHGSSTMIINKTNNPTVIPVVFRTGASQSGTTGIICAYATYGSGRIVGMGDSSIPEDVTPNSGTTYDGFIQPIGGSYDGHNGRLVSNATIWLVGTPTTTPTITVTPGTLSSFTYVEGNGPSSSQSFTLSGSNLDGTSVSVTSSTNYEVSLDNSTFSASVNVGYTLPTLSNTTIYVRLIAGLTAGTYNGELITCNDDGTAADKMVTVSGSVTTGGITTTCEDFNSQTGSSYGTSFSFPSGTWTCNAAGNFSYCNTNMGSYGFTINDDISNAHITTPSLNTCGTVSFKYAYINGTSTNVFNLQVSHDGTNYTTVDSHTLGASSNLTWVNYSFDVNDASNPVYLRVLSNNQDAHLFIDDFCWTNYTTGCSTPTSQASNVTFSAITSTSMTVNWTRGATPGDGVIVLAHEGAAVDANPVNGTSYTANSYFGNGSEIGTGNFVVFMGDGTSVNVTGLSASTGYYFKVYEYNCTGTSSMFNTTAPAAGNQTTIAPPTITLTGSVSNFGTYCVGSTSPEQSYTVSGSNLTADITVTAPFGFKVSTVSGGPYTSSVTLTQTGGVVDPTLVYAVFQPIAYNTYNEFIAHSSTGAVMQEQSVAGNGVTIPVLSTTAISAITAVSASSGGTITADQGSAVTVRGTCWNIATAPTIANFFSTDGSGIGTYTSALTGLSGGTTYYVRAYATNTCGTAYGNELSFATLKSEPSNHATVFGCGSSTSSSIQFTWTDAAGGTLPDAYLILCNTTGTFSDPIDGTPQADVPGSVMNVAQGVQSVTFTGLTAATGYYFKLYPYSNSGSNIDYKTDGTVLTGSCMTNSDPCVSVNIESTPTGWTQSGVSYAPPAHTGTNSAGLNTTGEYLRTALISNPDILTFWARTSSDPGSWTILVQTSPDGTTWTTQYTLIENGLGGTVDDTFRQYTVNIGLPGDYYIRWYMSARSADTYYMDDVEVYCGTGTDADSEVDGPVLASQPGPGTMASTIDTEGEAIRVFDFTIVDKGTADGLVTDVTQITIKPGSNNTADWAAVLQGVKLSTDNGSSFITTGTPVITAGSIVIPITSGNLQINDGATVTLQLFAWLNTSGITDNQVLEFFVDGTSHGFTADAAGSQFATTFSGVTPSPVSNPITITVTATQLAFVQQPTNTVVNMAMTPNPTVKACDVNGNIDVNYSSTITAASNGSMTGDPVSGTWSNGVATFSSLVHTLVQAGRTLTINDSGLPGITSNLFDITDVPTNCATDLIISEYVEGTGNNKYIELFNDSGSDIVLTDYDLVQYNNGGGSVTYTLSLAGYTILQGSTFIIENSSEALSVTADLSTTNSVMTFNGNDAVALRKSGVVIDIVGNPSSSSIFGEDVTLVRKSNITSGNTSYTASEWEIYSTDDITHLGAHTMTCTCEEPTVHASDISFSSITATSMGLSWISGDGISRIVVAREGLPVNWTPTDLSTYTANASFGSGTELGTGNYVVYNGSGSGFTLTNLTAGTTYYFKIFEYGCTPGNEDYLTSGTVEEGYANTLPNNITGLTIDCSTGSTMEVSWNLPIGNYDGILVTVLQGGTPPAPDCDGIGLNNPMTDYASASVYCANASGAKYVYNGIGTNVSISGLTPGESYTVKAFVYKNSAWSTGIEVTEVAELSDVSFLNAACGNTSSLVGWSNPNIACFEEVMIVAHTASISGIPSGTYTANSSSYTDLLNPTFPGGGVVVYTGTGEFVDVTSLSNNTTYYFKAFVRNGTDWSSGVEDNCMPTTASILDYGDLAIVGINTDTDDADINNDPDEIQFVCFKPITTLTAIDMTDNGYERLYADLWADSEGFLRFTRTGADLPAGTIVTVRGRNAAGNWHVFIGDGTDTHTLVNDDANWIVTDGGVGNQLFDLNVNDQIWIMQGGEWVNPSGLHNSTYTGKVLYGWTAVGWEPAPGYDDTKGSTIFPSSGCSVTNLVGVDNEDKVRYNGPVTDATQREWISRFNDEVLWIGSGTTAEYDASGTLPDEIVILTGGFSTTAQWTGETSTDWDDCTNWLNLKVPDATTNVSFITDNCYNDIVLLPGQIVYCNDLTITGTLATHNIKIEGDATKILEIRGDLTISGPNALDLDDANASTLDGKIILYGDWNNSGGTSAFLEGNSTVEFVGTDVQYINTSDISEDFSNLSVNNSSTEGLVLNDHVQTGGTLSLIGGLLNLNGFDLTINGAYTRNSGFFTGNAASDILVQGSGTLAPFYFSDPQVLNSFTMNRTPGISALATNLTMNYLTVTGGTVQLNAGKYFTVNTAINNTLASGLLLKSDASGTASLIHYDEGIPAISERYVEGGVWAYVFPPLSAVSEGIMGGVNPNFYWYNEPQYDYWTATTIYGTSGWTDVPAGALSTARGYIVYNPAIQVYNLTGGSLNYDATSGNKVFTANYTDSGDGAVNLNGVTADWDNFEGWNLFGNPFTSAIDWDQTVKNNMDNMVYYYDGAAQNYKYYGSGTVYDIGITVNGGSRYVPANQAFMVKATANGGTLTIPNSARVHDATAYWKSLKTNSTDLIRMEIEKDGFIDETVIRSLSEATYLHDGLYDAYKMFSFDKSKPMLFSRAWDNSYTWALNAIPIPKEHEIVPIGVYIGQSGDYTIRMTENSFEGIHVWLEDAFTKTEVNLREQSDYVFSQSLIEQSERFYLHLGVNRAPKLMIPLPDQETEAGVLYHYHLPEGLFIDEDFGDKITINADLTSGKALPEWLQFDAYTAEFQGTPFESQRLEIRLTATDIFGAQAVESFVLDVKSFVDVDDIMGSVSVYPNPAEEMITVTLSGFSQAMMTMTDVNGKTVLQQSLNGEKTQIDLSTMAKGIYFIKIISDRGTFNQKLMVR